MTPLAKELLTKYAQSLLLLFLYFQTLSLTKEQKEEEKSLLQIKSIKCWLFDENKFNNNICLCKCKY